MHIRTQIRNAVKNALMNLQATQDRVYTNIVYELTEAELPCIVITTEGETISYEHPTAPRIQTRNLELSIIATVRVTDTYQDDIDDILLQIEDRLGATENRTFAGLVQWHEVKDIQTAYDGGLEEPIAEIKITYDCKYRTKENDNSVNV